MRTRRSHSIVASRTGRWALVVSLVALVAACGNGGGSTTAGRSPLIDSLCTARTDAARGDEQGANREYFDHVHQRLHELAADVQRRDRSEAARLLEAHQRVEDDLTSHPPPPMLAEHLDQLRQRTAAALDATGKTTATECPS